LYPKNWHERKNTHKIQNLEPDDRIELTTYRLQGGCSTAELIGPTL
jgi:hypothetical protein